MRNQPTDNSAKAQQQNSATAQHTTDLSELNRMLLKEPLLKANAATGKKTTKPPLVQEICAN